MDEQKRPEAVPEAEAYFGVLASTVAGLAGTIGHEHFPPGDAAALRRIRPGETWPPAFWRLLFDRVPEELRRGDAMERRWAVVMQSMAIMAPNIHDPAAPLGVVLAGLGSDSMDHRLLQLLRAQGDGLEDRVRLVARMMAGKHVPVNWLDVTKLVMHPESDHIRRKVARDFYRAQYQRNPETETA